VVYTKSGRYPEDEKKEKDGLTIGGEGENKKRKGKGGVATVSKVGEGKK